MWIFYRLLIVGLNYLAKKLRGIHSDVMLSGATRSTNAALLQQQAASRGHDDLKLVIGQSQHGSGVSPGGQKRTGAYSAKSADCCPSVATGEILGRFLRAAHH